MRISVVGLGKLGAPLAAVLADAGHDVVGVDTSVDVVESVNEGRSPVEEPWLADLIARNRSRLRATPDAAAAAETEVTLSSSRLRARPLVRSRPVSCSTW